MMGSNSGNLPRPEKMNVKRRFGRLTFCFALKEHLETPCRATLPEECFAAS